MEFEPKLYNPAAQPEQWLIEHFVVRTKVFERIFEDIKNNDMIHPEQHYLIQGQRGMGKTTLLLRLKYEIERTPELKDWLMPVFFNEESYDLTSLSNLWEKLLKYFDSYFTDGGNYYKATDKYIGTKDYEQSCFNLIINILNKHKKKIVILFDNFGELFLDNLSERDAHRFREILMNCPELRIVAASAVVLESQNDYSKPFYDFFKVIHLEGLNKEETIDLIKKLQEKSLEKIDVEAKKARIETLTILTGGVIRTIIMLYDILLNDKDGSALQDLEKILDRVTPLYKHRMEDLKPQQRRIMDVIAKNWDAISTKDIAENIRDNGMPVPSKIISAQLQELEKNNLIEKIKTSTKNNFYIVKERFFNIWYLMRHGDRNAQCKVKWLTRFLETWYEDEKEGMDCFIKEYLQKLQSGNYLSASAINITNALLASPKTSPVNQALLLDATEGIVSEDEGKYLTKVDENAYKKAINKFEIGAYSSTIEILENTPIKNQKIIILLASAYYKTKQYKNVINLLEKLNNKNVSYILGISYISHGKWAEAEKELSSVISNKSMGLIKNTENQIVLAKIFLMSHYLDFKKNKEIALSYLYDVAKWKNNHKYTVLLLSAIYIWNNIFNDAMILLKDIDGKISEDEAQLLGKIVLILLSKKQYHTALNLFNNEKFQLKDILKPTYYALMYLLKNEYPDEYIKMGRELEQPVKDILQKIEQYAIDYA